MHWRIALCSLSTGTSSPPPRCAAPVTRSPPMTSDSLFASATRLPRSSAASVASSPAAPTTAFSTISALVERRRIDQTAVAPLPSPDARRRPFRTSPTYSGAKRADLLSEQRGVAERGQRRDVESIALTLEHAQRRRADRAGGAENGDAARAHRMIGDREPLQQQIRDRQHEDQAVEPVEHSAVPGDDARAVLHAALALEERLEQVAHLRRDADERRRIRARPMA